MHKLILKEEKKISHPNGKYRWEIAINVSDKTDFKAKKKKMVTREKEGYYTTVQEDIKIVNINTQH